MTQEEIQERNKQIALMLGAYTKQMMGLDAWLLEEDELNLSFGLFDEKLFSNNGGSGWLIKDLKFHSDWNWLMEAVEFVRKTSGISMVEGPVKQPTCVIHLGNLRALSGQSNTLKESVFIAVSDFAKLYNDEKL